MDSEVGFSMRNFQMPEHTNMPQAEAFTFTCTTCYMLVCSPVTDLQVRLDADLSRAARALGDLARCHCDGPQSRDRDRAHGVAFSHYEQLASRQQIPACESSQPPVSQGSDSCISPPSLQSLSSLWRCVRRPYDALLDRDGYFGISGALFDVGFDVREALEIVLQTYQACNLSRAVPCPALDQHAGRRGDHAQLLCDPRRARDGPWTTYCAHASTRLPRAARS